MHLKLSIILSVAIVSSLSAQTSDCRVLKEEISQSYEGECKKKLAHGYGVANGDGGKYEGKFKRGLPDGQGILNYVDGSYYEGEWRNGWRDGEGKYYHSADSILQGFWREDFYIGNYERPYKIVSQRGPVRYQFSKTNPTGNSIRFVFYRGGPNNRSDVVNLLLQNDSGIQVDNLDGYLEVKNPEFPFKGSINATVFNRLRTSSYDIYMAYEIFEKGSWTITINY